MHNDRTCIAFDGVCRTRSTSRPDTSGLTAVELATYCHNNKASARLVVKSTIKPKCYPTKLLTACVLYCSLLIGHLPLTV